MRDTRTTAEMVLARLRADAPSDTRGVDGKQATLRHQDRVPESEGTVNPGG